MVSPEGDWGAAGFWDVEWGVDVPGEVADCWRAGGGAEMAVPPTCAPDGLEAVASEGSCVG